MRERAQRLCEQTRLGHFPTATCSTFSHWEAWQRGRPRKGVSCTPRELTSSVNKRVRHRASERQSGEDVQGFAFSTTTVLTSFSKASAEHPCTLDSSRFDSKLRPLLSAADYLLFIANSLRLESEQRARAGASDRLEITAYGQRYVFRFKACCAGPPGIGLIDPALTSPPPNQYLRVLESRRCVCH